ncbi:MAG TPA: DUF3857 domain-containing protein [Ohtaekwangia sp.]
MRLVKVTLVLLCCWQSVFSQDHGFPFGEVTYRNLEIKTYEHDTATYAVVLKEFGEAYIDNSNDHNLLFEYHVIIKILKPQGVEQANIEIPLRKNDNRVESVRSVEASSFNIEGGSMRETKLNPKNVFTETISKYWDIKKFAIPNVRAGTVIEYQYILESPFRYNFRGWEFQGDIPKVSSEYWATIPANYKYHVSLRGFLELDKNESDLVEDCFTPGGGNKADCARFKWSMTNIPAFKEEEFMTARSNFISSINFELNEIEFFDGRKDKIAKEWKDAELELRRDERFGLQVKRGDGIVGNHIALVLAGETDSLQQAKKIYDFIKGWYRWNETYGIFSELGIKKAFDRKTGNVGDINLSLVAALNYAGMNVEPMILSTRKNGLPTELFPVISEFNYVVAKLNLGGKVYLLDATDDFFPFGLIPERCLNGKGRVLGEKKSYWYTIIAPDREKQVNMLTFDLQADGNFKGTIQRTLFGYSAVEMRKQIFQFGTPQAYINDLDNVQHGFDIIHGEITNLDDLSKPLVIKLDVLIEGSDTQHILFNPFVIEQWPKNPFRSQERLYPVDFGAPREEVSILNLSLPADYEVPDLPQKVGLALPNAGGRYLFEIKHADNRITMNSSLLIAKSVFTSSEYHHLKELFNHVVSAHQTNLLIQKRK